ncbi:ras GEF [Rhizopogon vinicolor AM-OR11-026]|uniref:Ras GEF n=1 Tax=Rhizopogon vinicolor AM-OR11-026 TaxID=1314800 RepID=A0A1B7N8E1_9AGAM|nr:ras GEF [Rhizopogon vinicolor AM-OR11-026]
MAANGLTMCSDMNNFPSQPTSVTAEQEHMLQLPEEQYITTFFCRARYDYQAKDTSFLSFHKNEVIEVITQLESGWWDGFLGDKRGWFPSNYVTVIYDEEIAEIPPSNYDLLTQQEPLQHIHEVTHDNSNTRNTLPNGFLESCSDSVTFSSDFWMPEVTHDGQIYYLNTQTGQHSRYLPVQADEVSLGGLGGLASFLQGSPSSTGAESGLRVLTEPSITSFGIPKRSGTPEPWVKRLTDDGMSYYYWNKLTDQMSWTIPETKGAGKMDRNNVLAESSYLFSSPDEELAPMRLRSDSGTSQRYVRDRNHSKLEHVSDSDDSGLYYPGHVDSPSASGCSHSDQDLFADQTADMRPSVELTAIETFAKSLQQSLSPSPPELISELSHITHDAIAAVIQKNESLVSVSRGTEHGQLDTLIRAVVTAVRNLLCICAPLIHMPYIIDGHRPKATASQALLKPAERKVIATLSGLVLSVRAMEYDSDPAAHKTASRIGSDAEKLDHAIMTFVFEVQRCQNEQLFGVGTKRVQGYFPPDYLGLGLVGAGNWTGFGWVTQDDGAEAPQRILDGAVFSEFTTHMVSMQAMFETFHNAFKSMGDERQQRVWNAGREFLSRLSSLLLFVGNIHIARHVDIDGVYSDTADAERATLYSETVDRARLLVRRLEAVVQALYDDAATLLLTMQQVHHPTHRASRQDRDLQYEYLDKLRMSQLSIIDSHFDTLPMSLIDPAGPKSKDIVDTEAVFGASDIEKIEKPGTILSDQVPIRSQSQLPGTTITHMDQPFMTAASSHDPTMSAHILVPSPSEKSQDVISSSNSISMLDDEITRAATNARKIKKILGDDPPEHIISTKPWYLRPDYTKNDIIIDVDGSVRAGTVPALVERLTSHDSSDPTFIRTFLMTYKSFTTLDELFDHLVHRFFIRTPDELSLAEAEEWRKLKQHIIQMRVLNTFKTIVSHEGFLDKEDVFILNRMKEFLQNEEVGKIAAAKQLLSLVVERARGGCIKKGLTSLGKQPPSIMPKPNTKLNLLDIDALELARQLTIMESHLYQKIRPVECLQRSREQKADHKDNITRIIQTSNRIANWVAGSVLSQEDYKKRAIILKQFISVADRCRSMHNYSSMAAIVCGLTLPPIWRLKRSWEQVGARHMAQFGTCEMTTINSSKNFSNYRSMLATVSPPCVPFIGVFLTTLTFIQVGSKDTLPGNLVNFRKRQKASEVIQDIQRWQTFPHNFHPIKSVQTYLEDSLTKFREQVGAGDYFWNLSLEREPQDERMTRIF